MKKRSVCLLSVSIALFVLFAVFTLLVMTVDVAAIGPQGSEVGFSHINAAVRDALGLSDTAHTLSELLGLVCLGGMAFFALVALVQCIRRRSLRAVDGELWLLGGAYLVTAVFYLVFELIVINYRPVLEDGALAASYPSSHTMLALVSAGTAALLLWRWISSRAWRITALVGCALCGVGTTLLRLLSGVHWLTDIVGGCLLAAAIVVLYAFFLSLPSQKNSEKNQ